MNSYEKYRVSFNRSMGGRPNLGCPTQALKTEQIRNIRERENVSQVVFAHYLNVSKGIVSQWERGEKRPSGTSLKLLSLVEKKGLSAIS